MEELLLLHLWIQTSLFELALLHFFIFTNQLSSRTVSVRSLALFLLVGLFPSLLIPGHSLAQFLGDDSSRNSLANIATRHADCSILGDVVPRRKCSKKIIWVSPSGKEALQICQWRYPHTVQNRRTCCSLGWWLLLWLYHCTRWRLTHCQTKG